MTQLSRPSAKGTARQRRVRGAVAVGGALVATAGFAATPSVLAGTPRHPTAHASSLSCGLASATRVKSTLGIKVGAPSVTKNGPVTVCLFAGPPPLIVRFETNESPSMFAVGRNSFTQHKEPTKTVSGLGNEAYSSSIGPSNTIVVLKGTTELLVTTDAPLAKVEALAKLIVPSL